MSRGSDGRRGGMKRKFFAPYIAVRLYCACVVGKGFALCVYGHSHCTSCAFVVCFLCHFLVRPKKWRKKGAKAFPLGTPCLPPFYDERRGFLFWQNSSILGAYIARPRWVCYWQEFLPFRFCLKFVQTGVRSRWQKLLLLHLACHFRARIFPSKCERKI